MHLSIIIPIKDERENISRLHDSLTAALGGADTPVYQADWGQGQASAVSAQACGVKASES